jgi:membrane protein
MRELFKDATRITNYNIILTIPLILFVKILDLYSLYSKYTVDSAPKFFLASITVLFMFGVFCSGWFYMVEEAVKLSKKVFVLDEDRAKATLNLFKTIPEGVGKFFLSFVGVYLIFFLIQIIATPIVYMMGVKIIGSLDAASMEHLQEMAIDPAITTNQGVAAFLDSLTSEQIIFFGKWSLLFMSVTSLIMYLLMLWIPEIIYMTPNPLVALWRSLVKLFKDFFTTVRLFLALWFMGFALLFINTFAAFNPFAYIIMSIILFYFSVYFVILIFLYYDRKYVELEDSKDEPEKE